MKAVLWTRIIDKCRPADEAFLLRYQESFGRTYHWPSRTCDSRQRVQNYEGERELTMNEYSLYRCVTQRSHV